jgi:CBS domain-containing protein
MTETLPTPAAARLHLTAATAGELMTPNPVSLRDHATAAEAIQLLTGKGFGAAPVIDDAGRPIGVLSQTDLLIHLRQGTDRRGTIRVRELMTPVVFSVRPETPAAEVVQEMVALKVHRMFVVDGTGTLVGVVSALDVLKHMQR